MALAPDACDHVTVNGQYQPTLRVRPQEVIRWRLVNAGYSALLHLRLPGCAMHVLAADGVFYDQPRPLGATEAVLIAPGSRRELAVSCPRAGAYTLSSVPPTRGPEATFLGPSSVFVGTLLYVEVAGPPLLMPLPHALPARPHSLYADLRTAASVRPFDFTWTKTAGLWGVNGRPWAGDPRDVQRRVVLGGVEKWRVHSNVTGGGHPFHLHTNHFQIVGLTEGAGVYYRVGDWRDTIQVPVTGAVTIRFRPLDYVGTTLAHCHRLAHTDKGMVMAFEIVPGSEAEVPHKTPL